MADINILGIVGAGQMAGLASEAYLAWIGTGAWQVGLVVALALTAAPAIADIQLAVLGTYETGIFDDAFVEARPEWTLPNKIVIGRVRDAGSGSREFWVIAGELPTDCVNA